MVHVAHVRLHPNQFVEWDVVVQDVYDYDPEAQCILPLSPPAVSPAVRFDLLCPLLPLFLSLTLPFPPSLSLLRLGLTCSRSHTLSVSHTVETPGVCVSSSHPASTLPFSMWWVSGVPAQVT